MCLPLSQIQKADFLLGDSIKNLTMYLQASKRESVAFNVGFSPLSNKKSLRRQQGFIQKQPQSSSQVSKLVNVFESKDSSASVLGRTPVGSASGRGETPVQSWRTWLRGDSAGRRLGDSVGRRSCQLDSDNKLERKINQNLADSFSTIQTGIDGNVNKTSRTVETETNISTFNLNEQNLLKTNSLRKPLKPPLVSEDSLCRQTSSVKKRQRSASFKGLLCGVKKAKLDDTYDEVDAGSYCEASSANNKENIAEEPFIRGDSYRKSVRRSLKSNFFLMNDSPGMTAPVKTISASHLPPKPTPVIKTVKSDSTVYRSILKKNEGVSNVGGNIKLELEPPRNERVSNVVRNIKSELEPPSVDLNNKFASPFRDLDSMFSVAPSPAFVGSNPAKLPPPEQPQTPDLAKQFNFMSIYNKGSPIRNSPRMDKKPSKTLLPWKKKSSSSTSRIKGTPVKIKLTPSIPKEFKSCSDLGGKEPIHPPTPVASTYKLLRYPIGMPGFSSTPAPNQQTSTGSDSCILEEIGANVLTPSKPTPKKTVSKILSKLTPRRSKVRPQENVIDRPSVHFAADPPVEFADRCQVDFNDEHF